MTSIVSNATPLIYLAKTSRLYLLKKLFGEVFIPEEVRNEVVDKGKQLGERDAYIVEKAIEDGWLRVLNVQIAETSIELEPGEATVLSLAKNLGRGEILVDEVSARTAARLMGIVPRCTIFVLSRALEVKEISLNEF